MPLRIGDEPLVYAYGAISYQNADKRARYHVGNVMHAQINARKGDERCGGSDRVPQSAFVKPQRRGDDKRIDGMR